MLERCLWTETSPLPRFPASPLPRLPSGSLHPTPIYIAGRSTDEGSSTNRLREIGMPRRAA